MQASRHPLFHLQQTALLSTVGNTSRTLFGRGARLPYRLYARRLKFLPTGFHLGEVGLPIKLQYLFPGVRWLQGPEWRRRDLTNMRLGHSRRRCTASAWMRLKFHRSGLGNGGRWRCELTAGVAESPVRRQTVRCLRRVRSVVTRCRNNGGRCTDSRRVQRFRVQPLKPARAPRGHRVPPEASSRCSCRSRLPRLFCRGLRQLRVCSLSVGWRRVSHESAVTSSRCRAPPGALVTSALGPALVLVSLTSLLAATPRLGRWLSGAFAA